jgi:protein-S-isoprenylcysteine O-methyltransferase Ste14
LFQPGPWTLFAGLSLASTGIVIIKIAFSQYDLKEFLGLDHITGKFSSQSMKREGLLSIVRHPLYDGSILAILGYFLFAPSIANLVTGLCLILYFVIGIYWEEKKLVKEFGDKYRSYQKQVPALLPNWKIIFRSYMKSKKNNPDHH